jgi:hypothetical protein
VGFSNVKIEVVVGKKYRTAGIFVPYSDGPLRKHEIDEMLSLKREQKRAQEEVIAKAKEQVENPFVNPETSVTQAIQHEHHKHTKDCNH